MILAAFVLQSKIPTETTRLTEGFLDLYTGKQRKNPKLWLDYFTSDAFLDVARERRFTALLLEYVSRMEAEYPVKYDEDKAIEILTDTHHRQNPDFVKITDCDAGYYHV